LRPAPRPRDNVERRKRQPAPLGGGMVKPIWFGRYLPQELLAAFARVVQSWDTVYTASGSRTRPRARS
jgi:hypothetical protein